MTDQQRAVYNMFTVVDAVLDANATQVATIAALGTAQTTLKANIAAISNTSEQQKTVTSGVTPDKNATRETLRTTTVINAGILYAYAVSVNDLILQSIAKLTMSDLKELKDDELADRAQTIHDNANAVIASLPPFGITAAILTSYQTLIDAYSTKAPAPRVAISQQVALTKQIKTLIKETRALCTNTLDKLMLNFKLTDPEFYNTYKAARVIIDPGTIPTQAAGTITDSATTNPVGGVLITVDGQSFVATSQPDGTYSLKIPAPGTYTLIFTKTGYQTLQKINIEITLGQTTTVNAQLIPA